MKKSANYVKEFYSEHNQNVGGYLCSVGKPTLAKAEEVKLMKEARELSAENIISSETGESWLLRLLLGISIRL